MSPLTVLASSRSTWRFGQLDVAADAAGLERADLQCRGDHGAADRRQASTGWRADVAGADVARNGFRRSTRFGVATTSTSPLTVSARTSPRTPLTDTSPEIVLTATAAVAGTVIV